MVDSSATLLTESEVSRALDIKEVINDFLFAKLASDRPCFSKRK
jgi:hypothetical protein